MAGEPLAGEVDSYSDCDSGSDDESINESINGASEQGPSIQKQGENEAMDEALEAYTFSKKTHGTHAAVAFACQHTPICCLHSRENLTYSFF